MEQRLAFFKSLGFPQPANSPQKTTDGPKKQINQPDHFSNITDQLSMTK